ncbi:MAG: hydantoinase B/oxoprolinase family protein [Steroidobacteraceae bacterium]
MAGAWEFWIDRGGTFTDVIGRSPDGRLHVRKVLSQGDDAGDACRDPGIGAAHAILAAHGGTGDSRVAAFKIGTTVATNALLERRGEPVVLVTTRGFADALTIGYQHRPDVFARRIVLPAPLHAEVIEADERIAADGAVVAPLDTAPLAAALRAAHARGRRSVAIVFVHGDRHSQHEAQAAALARDAGYTTISASHAVSPLVRYVARGDTTVFDAYLAPPLGRWLGRVAADARAIDPGAQLLCMQSTGGLVEAARFRAAASVLSGPAGGLTGMARIGAQLGLDALIGFDMGGTSTDVSVYAGRLAQRFEHELAGTRLQATMLDIHTIAAGGGSVLGYADGRMQVGPASAGSMPGPACYGRGGPLTVTDLQVALGRLHPAFLPAVFGRTGDATIDPALVHAALMARAREIGGAGAGDGQAVELAASWLEIAIESMANAVRQVCATHGEDPSRFALFCFGGAAPQHACAVAAACDMRRVVIHPLASVLSAFGIGVADWLETRRRSLRAPLDDAGLALARQGLAALEGDACAALPRAYPVSVRRVLEVRAGDSEVTLDVDADAPQPREAYLVAQRSRYGFADEGAALTIESVRIEARATPPLPAALDVVAAPLGTLPARVRTRFGADWHDTQVLPLSRAAQVDGPALIVDPHFTAVVEPGWRATRAADGALIIERRAGHTARAAAAARAGAPPDPARIEIFGNLFMHIATQMGSVLRDTAQSINIKERLDYSCALFDGDGRLLANAPHMPVHLGSMGASVREVIRRHGGALRAGDAWLLNSPYHGGTHLPDLTVVTPVFLAGGARPDAFVASRAHHADIGGITPGSMPPFSTHIDEEGVLFEGLGIVAQGVFDEAAVRGALAHARYPARNPDQNVADLRAQLAANARGLEELGRAARRHGLPTLLGYFGHVRANAEACVRAAIPRLAPGAFTLEMDGGQRIQVRIETDATRRAARIDFTGTSTQGAHNFNAPRAVCTAAVIYVFRTLIERPIPLNEGCLAPLGIVIPSGSMLAPEAPAAVVAGNVETSQAIVDALYGALGVLAASQGTMNNLTFGDATLQYYETIAGGAGAGPDFDGASAVQTHMTNSRLTDPEILELRYPVRLREFAIRRGSGGAGRHRGGDGIVRTIEFLAPMSGAILANRRRTRPFGLAGGAPGAAGVTRLRRANGRVCELAAADRFDVAPGDVIEVLTPGGGGYGAPDV